MLGAECAEAERITAEQSARNSRNFDAHRGVDAQAAAAAMGSVVITRDDLEELLLKV